MARSITVNQDNVVVGGAEHDTGDVVTITDAEFTALTDAGRFSGGSPMLTDSGEIQNDPDDDVFAQVAGPTGLIAMTSAVAAGGTPTKVEYDALRTDLINTRTYVTGVHTALTGAGKPFSS